MSRTLAALALLSLLLLLAPLTLLGQAAPVCDVTCSPDPSSPTYGGTLAARPTLPNARGGLSPIVPIVGRGGSGEPVGRPFDPPNPNLKGSSLPGSESYNYAIPILQLPGRNGLDLNLTLFYNSAVWTIDSVNGTATLNADRDWPSYGFRLNFGYIESDPANNHYILTQPDGTKVLFVITLGNPTNVFTSNDGSYIQLDARAPSTPVLTYKNGTQVLYQGFPNSAGLFRPISITDTNFNYITITYRTDTWATGQEINTITDTLGRVITYNYDANHKLATITQGAKTWATFTWGTHPLNYNFASSLTVTGTDAPGTALNVLLACTYPNGTGYAFGYGDWGIVNQIVNFPANSTTPRRTVSYNYPAASAGAISSHPAYTTQTVLDGVNAPAVWTYAVAKSGDIVSSLTVTDPAGSKNVTTLSSTGMLSQVQLQNSSGTALRTLAYTWTTGANPQIASLLTTLNDTNQQSKVTYSYTTYGNVSDISEYDFGLVLKRHTHFTYLNTSDYVNRYIVDRATQLLVEDAGGATVARTDMAYDGTTLAIVSGAANHDDAADTLMTGGPFPTRGDLTSVTRYANAAAGSGAVARSFSYDSVGNLISAQLDCCNQKTWAYSAGTQYAYPDSVTSGPTSGPQLTTSVTYDTSTGLVLSSTDENGKVTSFLYVDPSMGAPGPVNRLQTITRPDGVHTDISYDDTAALPGVTTTTSANNLKVVSTMDGLGREIRRDVENGSSTVSTVQTTYDLVGRVASRTNPYGPSETQHSTSYAYDLLGRVTTVTPPSGGHSQFDYSGNSVTTTDPAGKQRRSFSDALGRLVQVDEPGGTAVAVAGSGSVSISGSEQSGSVSGAPGTGSVTISGTEQSTVNDPCANDGTGSCPETIWDTGTVSITVNGFTRSASYGHGSTSSSIASALASALNVSGSPVTASASGSTVTLTATTSGTATNYPLSTSVTYDTDFFFSPSFTATRSGATLTGGLNATSNYDTGTVSITVNGFLASVNYGQGSTTSTVASALASALNQSSSPVTASASGSTVSITSKATGAATNYTLSASSSTSQPANFAHPSFTGSPSGSTLTGGADGYTTGLDHPYSTAYTYDVLDDLTQVSQGVQTRSYAYDSLGRLTASTTPESGTTNFYYTTSGGATCAADASAVCRKTDARNITSTYTYDGLNRVTLVTYSDTTPQVAYVYDAGGAGANALGRLTSVTVGTGSPAVAAESYTYDPLGRITVASESVGGTAYPVNYTYNPDNSLATIQYPSGRQVTQSYDAIGRMSTIASGGTNFLSGLSYNAAGQAMGFNYGNGVAAAFTYNDHLQLATLRYSISGKPDLLNLVYDYNQVVNNATVNNGQIQKMHYYSAPGTEDLTKTENFTYDAWGRLGTAGTGDGTSWGMTENYDRLGNRLEQHVNYGSAPNPIVSVDQNTNRINSSGYGYDAAGNMTNDAANTYSFDAENRITSVNSGLATYSYLGALRVKRNFGGTTVYVYAGTVPIAEYAAGAQVTQPNKEYIYSGSQLLATIDASLGTSYQYHDHLSTRVEADASANVTRTFGHFPFGETWYETGTASKWKFTSYERDSTGESDLDYADFRFDSSRLGRFMSSDPLAGNLDGPPSLDLYGYVLNDPVNLTDSTGMDPFLGCLLNELGNCSPGKTFSFSFDLGGNINACSGNGGLLDSFCAATHLGTQEFLARFQSYGIHDPVKEGMDPVGDMYKKYAGGLPGVCGPEVCPDSYTFKRQDRYLECDESRFCVWVNWVEATPIGAYNAALAPILTIKGSGAPKRHPPTVPR